MKHGLVVAGLAAVAISVPALAEDPIPLHNGATSSPTLVPGMPPTEVVQAQYPPYPPPEPSLTAPVAPPAPQTELPPPAPSPRYVWEPGHWSWNGIQYVWTPGRYVESPTALSTYQPGHWEQGPSGWVWVEGRWETQGVGSSTPPTR